MELREIGGGGEGEANIQNFNACINEAEHQGLFDTQRVMAKIMTDRDFRRYAALMHEQAEAFAQALERRKGLARKPSHHRAGQNTTAHHIHESPSV